MIRTPPSCHVHPQSLDSASTPEAFAERELELGTGVLTCTDHGSLGAAQKIYEIGKKNGLTPIIGLEAYFRDDNCPIFQAAGIPKEYPTNKDGKLLYPDGTYVNYFKYGHITLHCLDFAAYQVLVERLSYAANRAERHGSETKPLFNWTDLEAIGAQNITATSGCLIGMVQRHLLDNDDPAMALKYYERLRSTFKPGNFYTEIFPHVCDRNYESAVYVTFTDGTKKRFAPKKKLKTNVDEVEAAKLATDWQKSDHGKHERLIGIRNYRTWSEVEGVNTIDSVEKFEGFVYNECRPWTGGSNDVQLGGNRFVLQCAKRYGDKIIIGDDSHFVKSEDKAIQDIRLMTASGGQWRFHASYHRQSGDEMFAYFSSQMGFAESDFHQIVDNAFEWSDRFKGFRFEAQPCLPVSFYPDNTLKHTFDLINKHGRMRWDDSRYVERLKQEIALLHQNGTIDLLPYFFPFEEICELYRQNGMLTGPGRGSAAGVLLTYLLRITHIDPIEHGLSLNRFITLDRIRSGKLPDIDQDLPSRDLLVDPENGWLFKRFGEECVAQISTDTTLRLKNSVLDVARVRNGFVPKEIAALAAKFKEPPQGVADRDFVFGYDDSGVWKAGSLETDEALQEYVKTYPKDWEMVQKLLGLARSKGRHACAMLITDKSKPIHTFIPTMLISDIKCTAFTGPAVEAAGGLKMDFLTLNSLKDLSHCVRLIQQRSGVEIPKEMNLNGVVVPDIQIIPQKDKDGNIHYLDIWKLWVSPFAAPVFQDVSESKTETVFQFNCLDPETEALTKRGWIKGFELKVDDILLTKNPHTNALEWQAMTDLKLFPNYKGYVVELKNRNFHAITTPDHRWLVTNGSGKTVEKTSDTLSLDVDLIHRTGTYYPPQSSVLSDDEAELLGWFVTDGHYEIHKKCVGSRPSSYDESGIYAYISQSAHGNAEKSDRIAKLLQRLDLTGEVKHRIDVHGVNKWRLGPRLTKLLRQYARDRYLTIDTLLLLGRSALERLREAMILGDGHVNQGAVFLTTGRKQQAEAFQVLLMMLGKASSVMWRDMSKYTSRSAKMSNIPKNNGVYIVTELKSRYTQIKKAHYSKRIQEIGMWCPMVPNTFFVARRNGKVWITGNTSGAKQWLRQFNYTKPNGNKAIDSLEAMSAFTALDRPGPLDVGIKTPEGETVNMLQEYARRARGLTPSETLPIFSELFPETYGILVYQEQLERAYQYLTGCTGAEAEEFRSNVAKKRHDKILKAHSFFITNAAQKIGKEAAEVVWEFFKSWGRYGFNHSHSICYAAIGFACAYLKRWFPLEWWTAVLSNAKKEEISETFWKYCGHLIRLPDVTLSQADFCIQKDEDGTEYIRAPLNLLHGIGPKAHQQLVENGPYVDIYDFCKKIQKYRLDNSKEVLVDDKDNPGQKITKTKLGHSSINRTIAYTLIISGAMESILPKTYTDALGQVIEYRVVDHLQLFENALAESRDDIIPKYTAKGKLSKTKVEKVAEKYAYVNDLIKYQMRKAILAAYSEPLLPLIVSKGFGAIQNINGKWIYQRRDEQFRFIGGHEADYMNNISPWPRQYEVQVAVPVFITGVDFFKYDQGQKEACKVTFEVDGYSITAVKWPNRDSEKPPSNFTTKVVGAIAVMLLTKRSAKSYGIIDMILVQEPIDYNVTEKSPEYSGEAND